MRLRTQMRKQLGPLSELILYLGGGFLSTLLILDGRAPAAIALLSVCRGSVRMLCVLCGSVLGALAAMDFTAGLRHCGILVLIYAMFSAFRDTKYVEKELFAPLTAAGMTAAVELAYLLQQGVRLQSVLSYLTYLLLIFALSHYISLLLTQQRQSGEEGAIASLRKRLSLSAAAFRDLYSSLGKSAPSRNDENPSVVFDRAAEAVCRSCKQCPLCWSQSYIDTFNALNDATPAMLRRGKSLPEDYPDHFRDRCIHLPEFLAAVNQELSALLLRRQYSRRLEAERQRTRGQYAQLSEFLGQAAEQLEAVPAYRGTSDCLVGGAWRPKEGESVCGDVITHFETEGGMLYLLLSDGMGSGQEASREATNTVRLLEQFLRAGVEAEAALKTINAALGLRNEDTGSFTTIDLLSVKLSTREAALYKYGAAPTYIKRHGSVRRIVGSALPAGLQETHVVPAPVRFPLEPDTYVLLVSDGIVDASDDEWLQNLLAGWQGGEPQRLVSLLMGESKKHSGLRDDCSSLCLYAPKSAREV